MIYKISINAKKNNRFMWIGPSFIVMDDVIDEVILGSTSKKAADEDIPLFKAIKIGTSIVALLGFLIGQSIGNFWIGLIILLPILFFYIWFDRVTK